MIKAVFFDVDGTFVSHKSKSVPKSAREALDKLREKGIKVFLSTGRHMHELKNFPKDVSWQDGAVMGQILLRQMAEKP